MATYHRACWMDAAFFEGVRERSKDSNSSQRRVLSTQRLDFTFHFHPTTPPCPWGSMRSYARVKGIRGAPLDQAPRTPRFWLNGK